MRSIQKPEIYSLWSSESNFSKLDAAARHNGGGVKVVLARSANTPLIDDVDLIAFVQHIGSPASFPVWFIQPLLQWLGYAIPNLLKLTVPEAPPPWKNTIG